MSTSVGRKRKRKSETGSEKIEKSEQEKFSMKKQNGTAMFSLVVYFLSPLIEISKLVSTIKGMTKKRAKYRLSTATVYTHKKDFWKEIWPKSSEITKQL
jgi:hypothetical protein